jgi:RNA polymerase sigma-70 factor, ECF subfamily
VDDVADTRQDSELVTAMAAGDTEALHALNARYGRMLAALTMRFLRNESDAEEIAADVLWQAWRNAGSFDSDRGSVAVWLTTFARSRSIDRLRALKVRAGTEERQPDSSSVPDPASEIDRAERAKVVRAVLNELEANERTALELAYFSDLSQSEIAEKLGIPLGTVKTRIRGAMIKLRKALSGRRT